MGQDLPARAAAKAPSFAVWALKDPESGNLDRIQIIKVWAHPANGLPMEEIYDVAWLDNRKPDSKTGTLPPVGNTVDIKKATYTNDIGDTQLSAVWTDPDFNPKPTCCVLRAGAGDSNPALVDLRRGQAQPSVADSRSGDPSGAGLVIAHLVHAGVTPGEDHDRTRG